MTKESSKKFSKTLALVKSGKSVKEACQKTGMTPSYFYSLRADKKSPKAGTEFGFGQRVDLTPSTPIEKLGLQNAVFTMRLNGKELQLEGTPKALATLLTELSS